MMGVLVEDVQSEWHPPSPLNGVAAVDRLTFGQVEPAHVQWGAPMGAGFCDASRINRR